MARGRAKQKQKKAPSDEPCGRSRSLLTLCECLITVCKETYGVGLVLVLQCGSKKVPAQARHRRKRQQRRQGSRRRGGKRHRMEFCSGEQSSKGKNGERPRKEEMGHLNLPRMESCWRVVQRSAFSGLARNCSSQAGSKEFGGVTGESVRRVAID